MTLNLASITAAVSSTLAMVHTVEPLAGLMGGPAVASALSLVDEAGSFVDNLIANASQASDVNESTDLSFIKAAQAQIEAANDRLAKLVDVS